MRAGAAPLLLIATTNAAKQRELSDLLADLPLRIVSLRDLPGAPEVEETGQTFEANALLKARAYAAWAGLPALADDGGLEIDALDGEPGVRSRRWIDDRDASDEELIAYTLERMAGLPPDRRGAAMRVVEALVLPAADSRPHPALRDPTRPFSAEQVEILGTGSIRGVIPPDPTPRRLPGFPFRSLFYLPDLRKYYVDLTDDEHALFNHRRAALAPIRAWLSAGGLASG